MFSLKVSLYTMFVVAYLAALVAVNTYEPTLSETLAVKQLENTDQAAENMRLFKSSKDLVYFVFPATLIVLGVLLFAKDFLNMFKKVSVFLLAISMSGCFVYDKPEFIEIGSSHTAFLIPLEGSSEDQSKLNSKELLEKSMISLKRVQIPHKWVQLGYGPVNGKYVDTVRLIAVNRAPVTRTWKASKDLTIDQGIWVESADSVGFSTGITCTAKINDDSAATKFLYNYPLSTKVENNDDSHLIDNGEALSFVLDNEVRSRIQSLMAEFSAAHKMDKLRELKSEMLNYVKYGVVPEDSPESLKKSADVDKELGVIPYFEERGITITTIGQFDGFTYENPKIQEAIDSVFEAQQDEEVAKAETNAQTERNKAIKLAAEGKAEAARAVAMGEADAIKTVADAKAYEIKQAAQDLITYLELKRLEIFSKQVEKWDGTMPQNLFSADVAGFIKEVLNNSK